MIKYGFWEISLASVFKKRSLWHQYAQLGWVRLWVGGDKDAMAAI